VAAHAAPVRFKRLARQKMLPHKRITVDGPGDLDYRNGSRQQRDRQQARDARQNAASEGAFSVGIDVIGEGVRSWHSIIL